ncbi:MAG TPA: GatB/YqeY domain-containing protein [Verrucomicrobiae bacterium]|nr:GatB/YqeY domain-containing protein [Verrucomicrobiae bacterium]
MSLKQRLETDIKAAMLSGDRFVVDVLKGLKSAILYEEVAQKRRELGLDDAAIEAVFAKQAKQRDESADLFDKGGNHAAAQKERAEKEVILRYLPEPLSETELHSNAERLIQEHNATSPKDMGKVLGALRAQYGSRVDGAKAAAIVKELLQNK